MASIRKDKSKDRWVFDHVQGATRTRLFFSSRNEATEFKRDFLVKVTSATLDSDQQESPPLLLKEAVERYLLTVTSTKAPATQYFERILFKEFTNYFRGTLLNEIKLADLQGYQAYLRQSMLGQTVNRRFTAICHFFGLCLDWELIKDDPTLRLKKLPTTNQRAKRALTEEELTKVLKAAKPWLRDILWFILVMGVRRSEAVFLRWGSIDLARKYIHLEASKGFDNKDHESNTLPMTETMDFFLRGIFEKAKLCDKAKCDDFVFVDDRSKQKFGDRLTHEAKKLMQTEIGLQSGAVHILRHTSLTMRHRQGTRVIKQLPKWIEDYNEHAPHAALKMRSPREYQRALNMAG